LSTFLCFLYFVLKVKCAKFHQNRSKTVDLHTKQTFKQRSNLARFYGTLATLATTRKAMGGRNKPTYVVIGRSGLSIYPIYIFSLWAGPPSADRGLGLQWTSPSAADNVIQRRRCRCRRYRRLVFPTGAIHPTTARHRSHPAADRPPPGNDHLLDGNNGSGHHSATAPGVSSVRHSAHTNSRSAGRPAVSRRDASPTPEGEANPHRETRPPICPARRDTSGLGTVTDPRTPPGLYQVCPTANRPPSPAPERRDRSPNRPGPYQVCATQPREHIRRTATPPQ
jgi:hypothetical protein